MSRVLPLLSLILISTLSSVAQVVAKDTTWITHPYFGYQYLDSGRVPKIIESDGKEISPTTALGKLSLLNKPFFGSPKADKSYWLLVSLKNQKTDSVLISFGLEQQTRWGNIDVYSADNSQLIAKGGVNCKLHEKTFRTNADVFKLASGHAYVINLRSNLRNRDSLAFNLLLYKPSRYFDFGGYTFPAYFHQAGGYLYGFNLIKRSLEVYCDSTNSASLASVKSDWNQRAFVSYNQQPDPDLTYWMRFSIHNPESARSYLMGVNSGSFWNFDSITVFLPQPNGEPLTFTLGQKMWGLDKPFGIWNNVFPIQLKSGQSQEVFIKVTGFNRFFIPDFQVSHIKDTQFWQVISWIKFVYGFFLGLIIVQFLYYFIRFFLERELLHLYFSLFVLGIGLWISFFSTDLHYTPLPTLTQLNIPLASLGMAIAIIFIYAYQYQYLSLNQYQLPFKKIFQVLAAINTLICLNYAISFSSFGSVYPLRSLYLQLVILSLLVNYLVVTSVGVYTIFKRNTFGRAFTFAFIPLLLGIIIRFVVALILILQGGTFNQFLLYLLVYGHYVLMAGIAFALIMMAINTAVRFNKLKVEKLQAEKFKEINNFKSRFYTNITHEFRTPLTAILGTSETLKKGYKRDVIDRNGQKLLNLVNELLDMSRAESTSVQLNLLYKDLVSCVVSLVQQQLPLAEQKGLRLELTKDIDSLWMEFDDKLVDKVISNLLSNAIKFTPKGGLVSCKISQKATKVIVEVSDTGIGIAPHDLPHIFQRFYQADTSNAKGTGVGLALATELTEYIGGSLEVTSEVNRGSTFTLSLPIQAHAVHDDRPKQELLRVPQTEPSADEAEFSNTVLDPNKPTVLVIEDNTDVLALIINPFKADYNVLTAPNGAIGVNTAIQYIPDVVITDVMMPIMDGYELCNQLKHHPATDHIPIIMLTAKVDRGSKIAGLELGADAYIGKPFDKEEVLLTTQNFLDLQKKLHDKFTKRSADDVPQEALPPFLVKVNAIISEHLADESFATETLCELLNLSRSQVFRKIKALSGVSTQLYIRTIRLKEARAMLKATDKTIAEVAFACGFSDPSYFTKVFQEMYQSLPSELR